MAGPIKFNCDYCGIKKIRPKWEYNKTKHHFCSQECAKQYQKENTILPIPTMGEKYKSLTFIKTEEKHNKIYYICQCDCGETTSIQRSKWKVTTMCNNRKNHKGEKCGAFRGYGEISLTHWNSIIRGAKKRKLEFLIDIEYAWDLFLSQARRCALSNVSLIMSKNYGNKKTASLDRIDSSKGYIEGNVQWVHKNINKLKMDLKDDAFKEMCYNVAQHSKSFPLNYDFEDVLIKPQKTSISSRSQIDLLTNNFNDIIPNVIPIIASNIDTIGNFKMAKALMKHNIMTCLHKHYSTDELINFFSALTNEENNHIFYSLGIIEEDFEKLKIVSASCKINNVCLDVANAYIPQVLNSIAKIKTILPSAVLMVGSIATPEPLKDFAEAGVDIVKIGIGSGGVCITRIVAGVGIPQLSCILGCVEEAKKYNIKLCSDGGCKQPGDVIKAFAAGADSVMIGSMFSGTDECEGEWIERNGERYLKFYGMASAAALNKHGDSVRNYRASEGKTVEVKYRGSVEPILQQILGGLRSCCSYIDAKNLYEISPKAQFIKVNRTHNTIFGDEK